MGRGFHLQLLLALFTVTHASEQISQGLVTSFQVSFDQQFIPPTFSLHFSS